MPKNVLLAVDFLVPADRLFEMYLEAETHAAITGSPVTIEARAGAPFRAFDGILTGTILQVEPKRLIVQSWRSTNWPAADLDSTLVLTFVTYAGSGRIELAHINVPDEDFAGVSQGWEKYYWGPWRKYLADRSAG